MSEQDNNGMQPEETTAPAEGEPQAQGEGEQENPERTFTQDDINRIISKRVQEERARADAQLKQREAEIARREYDYHVLSTLENKQLPPQLADILKGGDAATFDASLAAFEKLLHEATDKAVIKRLAGSPPPSGGRADPEAAKRAGIRQAMGLGERMK